MKWIICLSILLLLGCAQATNLDYEMSVLCSEVGHQIEYTSDIGKDYCQSPDETILKGTGDCEDMTILFMYLCNKELGIKTELIIVDVGDTFHCISYYNGIYYDPTLHGIYTKLFEGSKIIFKCNYDVAMIYATRFYSKGENKWLN